MQPAALPAGSVLAANPPVRARGGLRAWLATPAAMVLVALVLRLAAMTLGHTYRHNPRTDHFGFGWETGRIARAIAEGEGFSSPFHGRTGPTAWVAPLYPYLVAGVFKIFGVYTYGSAWVLLALNSLFSALTCWVMYLIAAETVGLRIARWAGWMWALLPYSMYWAIRWVWETSFSALLLALALWLALRVRRDPRLRNWAWFGLAWGTIALSNPSCLSVLPFVAAWLAYRLGWSWDDAVPAPARRGAHRRWLVGGALAAALCVAMVLPWTLRNYRVFGKFIPIRSNFGVELRLGNSMDANGLWMFWFHPTQDNAQMARYVRLGEIGYTEERGREARQFMRAHPGKFAELCLRRAIWFWIGTPKSSDYPLLSESRNALFLLSTVLAFWGLWLMIRDRRPGSFLFSVFLLAYPAVYYLTFPHPRYRHPIEPVMVIAGLYLFAQAIPEKPARA